MIRRCRLTILVVRLVLILMFMYLVSRSPRFMVLIGCYGLELILTGLLLCGWLIDRLYGCVVFDYSY